MKTIRIFVVIILAVLWGQTVRADTATMTIVYNFGVTNGTVGPLDGSFPVQPPIIGTDGNFYGTTFDGGTDNDGTVYMMTPQGTLTSLYSFQGYDGVGPRGLLYETNGLFYGSTQSGGINITSDNICCGTLFTVTPQGTFTTIYNFIGTNGETADSGIKPGGDGNFYGTTYGGGTVTIPYTATNVFDSYGDSVQNPPGTIYRFTPLGPGTGIVTTLYSFSGPDGANPGKEAVIGTDGNIYGTTVFGGEHNYGTVFTLSSAGTFTSLYSFANGTDGAHPKAQLIEGPDGNFYGTTLDGGGKAGERQCSVDGCGTVFKITPQGALTTLHDFTGDPEPAHPGSLALGPDGNFYGTSNSGGTNHEGTIFMITPEGVTTTLYQFDIFDGAEPVGGLTLASDGSFYGTTSVGGVHDQGTVFRVVISTNNPISNCTFTLNAPGVTIPAAGGSKSVTVKVKGTGCSWTASTTNSWITITSGNSGTVNGTVVFNVPGNTNAMQLNGSLTIAGQTIAVTQDSGGCTYSLSPKNAKFKDTGGSSTVKVTPNFTNCNWTAVSSDPFITITSGANEAGKGTVSYTVASNATTEAINGSIMIGGQTFAVTEAATPCEISLSQTVTDFSSVGGSSNVTVTANGTNCLWNAVVSGSFITINSGGTGPGNGTVDYTVAANTKTTPRNGTITVGKEKLTIKQSGTAP
jgi:uncharacterized repeat protein (TIGR03803 family)